METPVTDLSLNSLALIATIAVLSILTATLLTALEDAGLRSIIHRHLLRSWFTKRGRAVNSECEDNSGWLALFLGRETHEMKALVRVAGRSVYSLPYPQLCGQVGAAIQADSDIAAIFAGNGAASRSAASKEGNGGTGTHEEAKVLELLDWADLGLNDLQSSLAHSWAILYYLAAVGLPPGLILMIQSGLSGVTHAQFAVLWASFWLIAPLVLSLLNKFKHQE
jgi:hypothetical protein